MKDKYGDLNGLGRTVMVLVIVVVVTAIVGGMMAVIPRYNVWSKGLNGEAQLREAEYSKQILVREAEAKLEAEKLNALAEIERAKGMAEAMEIENGRLTETYIKYLWVRGMADNDNIVYIPTEAALPILEINRP